MMRPLRYPLPLLFLLGVASAQAQEFPDDYTRRLLPVTAFEVPGANGSIWTSEWTVYNGSGDRLFVAGPFPYLPPPPIWAFVSISHNTTQQVTTILP